MKDVKKAVSGQKAEMMRIVGDIQWLADREKQTTDPTTQQLVKKLRRTASDTQIRYSRVCVALNTYFAAALNLGHENVNDINSNAVMMWSRRRRCGYDITLLKL